MATVLAVGFLGSLLWWGIDRLGKWCDGPQKDDDDD